MEQKNPIIFHRRRKHSMRWKKRESDEWGFVREAGFGQVIKDGQGSSRPTSDVSGDIDLELVGTKVGI